MKVMKLIMSLRKRFCSLIIFIMVAMVLAAATVHRTHLISRFADASNGIDFSNRVVSSILRRRLPMDNADRNVTYTDVLSELYIPLGYSLREEVEAGYPFLPLHLPKRTCQQVFQDWLDQNERRPSTDPPPPFLSTDPPPPFPSTDPPPPFPSTEPPPPFPYTVKVAFLMDDLGGLSSYFFTEDAKNGVQAKANTFSPGNLQVFTDRLKVGNFESPRYGSEGAALFYAMVAHPPGARGMTVGTLEPWVEAIARFLGHNDIIINEYQPINIDPRLTGLRWAHPLTIANNVAKYGSLDWVATFSSLEHSGLGRYGDLLDPIGDLREAHKIHCLLKPGGLFFLGLPAGATDGIAWNAHRIYSYVRWPLMAAGFRVLGMYRGVSTAPTTFAAIVKGPHRVRGEPAPARNYDHVVAVLEKMA